MGGQADKSNNDLTCQEPDTLSQGETIYRDLGRVDDINKYYLDSNGTLRIRVTFSPEFPGMRKVQLDTQVNSHTRDLRNLLESEAFSGLTLVAEEKHFRVHQNILSARSPVFQSMLTARMSESTQAQVVIPDMKAATMTAFLQFLYAGSCDLEGSDSGSGFGERKQCDLVGRWHSESLEDGVFEITEGAETVALKRCGSSFFDFSDGAEISLKQEGSGTWAADFAVGERLVLKLKGELLNIRYEHHRGEFTRSARRPETLLQTINAWGELLKAADKYCVVELAAACETQLLRLLCAQSAATVLRTASEAGRQDLKRRVLQYITESEAMLRAVKDTCDFDLLDRELALEIMDSFLHPRYSRKHPRQEDESREFADDEDWTRLSSSQLRRACAERNLMTDGSRERLVRLLQAQAA